MMNLTSTFDLQFMWDNFSINLVNYNQIYLTQINAEKIWMKIKYFVIWNKSAKIRNNHNLKKVFHFQLLRITDANIFKLNYVLNKTQQYNNWKIITMNSQISYTRRERSGWNSTEFIFFIGFFTSFSAQFIDDTHHKYG